MMISPTIIILYYVLFIGLANSKVIKFNQPLTPNLPVHFECGVRQGEFASLTASDIKLTTENGFLNLVPLDICGELVGSTTPVERCSQDNKPSISFTVKAYEQTKEINITATIENGRIFCTHINPCEFLSLLKKDEVKVDQIPTTKFFLSYSLDGYVKKTENFKPSDEVPSFKVSLIGSRLQLDNTSTSKFNETFIGSIAATRHNATCNLSDCGLTIGGLEKPRSNRLKYTKGSNNLPECDWRSEASDSDANVLYSTVDYFKVENVDKLPVDTEYEVISRMSTTSPSSSSTSSSTSRPPSSSTSSSTSRPPSSPSQTISPRNKCSFAAIIALLSFVILF